VSDESGQWDGWEVFVRPFPGPGGKWLISHEGGLDPLWAKNGKQLFYRSEDDEQVWVVDVRTDGGFLASKPRLLFKEPGLGGGGRAWDLSLDPQPVTEMILVQNWFEELRRLVPTGKK
jgi:hypothetical protein